jgi:uncharacterized integral membrane protein
MVGCGFEVSFDLADLLRNPFVELARQADYWVRGWSLHVSGSICHIFVPPIEVNYGLAFWIGFLTSTSRPQLAVVTG